MKSENEPSAPGGGPVRPTALPNSSAREFTRCWKTAPQAAEELGYAQPSISEQIRSLEKSCGAQLFRRVGRGVVPTTVADTLRPHAERTLAAAEEAYDALLAMPDDIDDHPAAPTAKPREPEAASEPRVRDFPRTIDLRRGEA